MINRICFTELSGRDRAFQILDEGKGTELLGPLWHLKSPHLAAQGIVPQNDDGMIIVRGTLDGVEATVISMEGKFQGGGIGEISGAKFAAALENCLDDNKNGKKNVPILLFDTGGVRLQEANYGLLAISEIQSLIVELQEYVPVVGIVPGRIGCFGGMSMTAGLFTYLIMTREGRLTLNGPEVIEEEAGKEEWDASDKKKIWDTTGGEHRVEEGLADCLVNDDLEDIRQAAVKYSKMSPEDALNKKTQIIRKMVLEEVGGVVPTVTALNEKEGRGSIWFAALSKGGSDRTKLSSVRVCDSVINGEACTYIAVVPDELSQFPRARHGEVGLQQGLYVAAAVDETVAMDKDSEVKRPIIAVVDVPSQAYGYKEEFYGLSFTCAAAVNAYVSARMAGHPIITLIVGNAISGAFLAHGLQGSYFISLDDETITVHAMSKKSAAKITKRSADDLDSAAAAVPAIAYDIHSFNCLGAVRALLKLENHDQPTEADLEVMIENIVKGIADSRANGNSLKNRLETENAAKWRKLSIDIRKNMKENWV